MREFFKVLPIAVRVLAKASPDLRRGILRNMVLSTVHDVGLLLVVGAERIDPYLRDLGIRVDDEREALQERVLEEELL